jgi:hypothetical protein
MVVEFTTTCAISAYYHKSCEFEPRSWQGVLDTTLCDKVCQWFSPGTSVSSTNKTDCHQITEILLKVALNIINYLQIKYSNERIVLTYGYRETWFYTQPLLSQFLRPSWW